MTEAMVAFTTKSFVAGNLRYRSGWDYIGCFNWELQSLIAFKTSHASVGLTTFLAIGGTISGGIAAKYGLLKTVIKPAVLKIVHSSFGVLGYVLGIYTFCLGLDSVWFRAQASQLWIDILTYGAGIVAILALIKPLISIESKLRNLIKSKG